MLAGMDFIHKKIMFLGAPKCAFSKSSSSLTSHEPTRRGKEAEEALKLGQTSFLETGPRFGRQ